jgi:signal transduction histidine kinase
MRQVMEALLSNAVKFTPLGGQVTLSAAPAAHGGSIVTVADTGIGMAPEDIPRAFEAFTQLEAGHTRRYPGSGLGLYLARALAGAMGLTLTLESEPGRGTTARLVLPPAEEISA